MKGGFQITQLDFESDVERNSDTKFDVEYFIR